MVFDLCQVDLSHLHADLVDISVTVFAQVQDTGNQNATPCVRNGTTSTETNTTGLHTRFFTRTECEQQASPTKQRATHNRAIATQGVTNLKRQIHITITHHHDRETPAQQHTQSACVV